MFPLFENHLRVEFHTAKSRRRLRVAFLILLAIGILSPFGLHQSRQAPIPSTVNSPPPPAIPITSFGTTYGTANLSSTGPSLAPGKMAEFVVNITDAPPSHGFAVQFMYNHDVLNVASGSDCSLTTKYCLDVSGGILSTSGANTVPLLECVDGDLVTAGGSCTTLDNTGVVTLFAYTNPNQNSTATSGFLFTVTFKIVSRGVSQIHFLRADLSVKFTEPETQTYDGYFSNVACGNRLCKPPVASFQVSPQPPFSVSKPVTFDASASSSPNLDAQISGYHWFWGTDQIDIFTRSPIIVQTFFLTIHEDFITLIVNDTDHFLGYTSVRVQVVNIVFNLSVNRISTDQYARVIPGTRINITAVGQNGSSSTENVTLAIIVGGTILRNMVIVVGGTVLANKTFPDVPNHQSTPPMSVLWDTTGLPAKVYRIEAVVSPLRDSSGNIIQSDLSSNILFTFVQLVDPLGRTLVSLSLLQTTGLSLVALVGLGVAVSYLLRKRHEIQSVDL